MNKILGLIFLFQVLFTWAQEGQKSSFNSQFMDISHDIGRLVHQEDSLYLVMLSACSELKSELESKVMYFDGKRSVIESFINANNAFRISQDEVKGFDISDAADILNFSLKYNVLELIRSNISDCQNTLENKRSWITEHSDSLQGAYRIIYKGTTYDLYITDLKDQEIELHHKKKGSLSLKYVKNELE